MGRRKRLHLALNESANNFEENRKSNSCTFFFFKPTCCKHSTKYWSRKVEEQVEKTKHDLKLLKSTHFDSKNNTYFVYTVRVADISGWWVLLMLSKLNRNYIFQWLRNRQYIHSASAVIRINRSKLFLSLSSSHKW